MNIPQDAIDRIIGWYRAGLDAVEPRRQTAEALAKIDVTSGRVVVLAVGKAAEAMAFGAVDALGEQIERGVIVTKEGHLQDDVPGFVSMEAGHPVPNQASLEAGSAVIDAVTGLGVNDTVVCLISGGGSALVEQPISTISLMDVQITTEVLMFAGADITDLNTVRRSLSDLKGGGLRRHIGEARCVSLILSDVLGNDLETIASGLTIPQPRRAAAALDILRKRGVIDQVPKAVIAALSADGPPDLVDEFGDDVVDVIGDNWAFVAAVADAVDADGLRPDLDPVAFNGEARGLAELIVERTERAPDAHTVLIIGGEPTVVVRGHGKGGRNTEVATIAATLLSPDNDWLVASLASDGDDGNSRATGGVANAATGEALEGAKNAIVNNDSATWLESQGGLVRTGPTGTNVNDVVIAVRASVWTEGTNDE